MEIRWLVGVLRAPRRVLGVDLVHKERGHVPPLKFLGFKENMSFSM
jgi:hypothetical protein